MATPTITKIEAIPQIWAYKKSWLDDVLGNKIDNGDTPGNFFGIIDNGTDPAKFKWWPLNTYLDETDAVKITLCEASPASSIPLTINFEQIKSIISSRVSELYGLQIVKYVTGTGETEHASDNWVEIVPVDKQDTYVIPYFTADNSNKIPVRIRFILKVTYTDSGSVSRITQLPNGSNKTYYEVVLNSDKPFDMLDTKEYAVSTMKIFDNTGTEIVPANNIFEVDYSVNELTPLYVYLKVGMIGCALADDLYNIDSCIKLNNVELAKLTTIPAAIASITDKSLNSWALKQSNGEQCSGANDYLMPTNCYVKNILVKITSLRQGSIISPYIKEISENKLTVINEFISNNEFVYNCTVTAPEIIYYSESFNLSDSFLLYVDILNYDASYTYTDVSIVIEMLNLVLYNGTGFVNTGGTSPFVPTPISISNIASGGDGAADKLFSAADIIAGFVETTYGPDVPMQFQIKMHATGTLNGIVTESQEVIANVSLNMKDLIFLDNVHYSIANNRINSVSFDISVLVSEIYNSVEDIFFMLKNSMVLKINGTQSINLTAAFLYSSNATTSLISVNGISYRKYSFTRQILNNPLVYSGTTVLRIYIANNNTDYLLMANGDAISIIGDFDILVQPDVSEPDNISEMTLTRTQQTPIT